MIVILWDCTFICVCCIFAIWQKCFSYLVLSARLLHFCQYRLVLAMEAELNPSVSLTCWFILSPVTCYVSARPAWRREAECSKVHFYLCSFICYHCEHDGTSDPRVNGQLWGSGGRSQGHTMPKIDWRPGRGISLDPLASSRFSSCSTEHAHQLPDSFRQPRQSCLDSSPHSFVSSSLSSPPLSSSITLSLQAQNLPFQQILPTLDFFYLPDCLHDNGTGLDLSRSSVYF